MWKYASNCIFLRADVKCLFQGNKLKAFAANAAKDPMLKIRSSDNGRDQDQAGQLSEISLSILI